MPAKKATRYLAEERFAFSGGTVDRSDPNHPKIIGALICGRESPNQSVGEGSSRVKVKGRRYLAEAFSGDRVKRYNGSLVYLNHPSKITDSRIYQDKIAVVENARHRQDGMPLADLAVNPKNPHAEQFLWDAEHAPNSCGMSHRALCEWRTSKDGFAEAIELIEVLSVDVVTDPATTTGVFEHKEPEAMSSTIKQVAEWIVRNPKSTAAQCIQVKPVAEEFGAIACEAPEEETEPQAAIDAMLSTLMHAHLDELIAGKQAVEDFIKRVKMLHKVKVGESKEIPTEPTPSNSRASIGYDRAITLCSESKFHATPLELKSLAKFESDADAKAYIAEQTARSTEQKPRSSGRTVAQPPKQEAVAEQRLIPAWNRAASRN